MFNPHRIRCIASDLYQGMNALHLPSIESDAMHHIYLILILILILLLTLTSALAGASGGLLSFAHRLAHQGKLSLLRLVAEGEEALDSFSSQCLLLF